MVRIFQERRKSSRLDCSIPVQYKNIRQFAQVPKGTITKDIGERGTRFISNEFILPSATLNLEISLPYLAGSIRALSRVVWIQKRRFGDQYDVGMEFIEIAKEGKEYIKDFIKKSLI